MANITYSLIDDFDLKGVWWLPENPELHISGVISFKNGERKMGSSLCLTLDGKREQ
jgi:hypothetical protein